MHPPSVPQASCLPPVFSPEVMIIAEQFLNVLLTPGCHQFMLKGEENGSVYGLIHSIVNNVKGVMM